MARPTFGATVVCRTCRGEGQVRHKRDPEAERERARRRRHGEQLEEPPTHDPCPTCAGTGIVDRATADRPLSRKEQLIADRSAGS